MEHSTQSSYSPEDSDLEPEIQESEESARRVVNRAPHRKVGRINIPYVQPWPVEHESQLEKRFLYRAILTPGLRCAKHQPMRLSLSGGRSYTPDFRLDFSTHAIVEVKWSTRVDRYIDLFNFASQVLAEHGRRFYVITEEHVDRHGASEDAQLIARYGKCEYPRDLVDQVLRCAEQADALEIGKLLALGAPRGLVMYMLATRQLFLKPGGRPDEDAAQVAKKPELTDLEAFETAFDVKPWSLREPVPLPRKTRTKLPKRKAQGLAYTLTEAARDVLLAPPAKDRRGFSIEKFFASKLAAKALAGLSGRGEDDGGHQ